MSRWRNILLLLILLSGRVFSQDEPSLNKDRLIEQKIETIVENIDNDQLDFQNLFEMLMDYIQNPLNLNSATREELYAFPQLRPEQIESILEHREKYGMFTTIYEIRLIKNFDKKLIDDLAPFVYAGPVIKDRKIEPKALIKFSRQEIILRWHRVPETQKGYTDPGPEGATRYAGSPDRYFLRYRYRFNKSISAGITAEKDPGEEFFSGSQPHGFDYYSAHFYYKGNNFVKAVALGDFQAQFGQGLTFWSGLALGGKTAYATDISLNPQGLRPHTSANEALFLRGGGITVGAGRWTATTFFSSNKVDANRNSSSEEEEDAETSSLSATGFHRTPTEIARKNSTKQKYGGANFQWRGKNLQVGITAAFMELDAVLKPRQVLYNKFRFSGNKNSAVGINYNHRIRNFSIFGETTRGQNGSIATVNGVFASLHPRFNMVVLHRHYPQNFQPLSAIAFSESQPSNETGIYWGGHFHLFKKMQLLVFYDQFSFPWLRFRVNSPSKGFDILSQLEYRLNTKNLIQFRYREKEKPINITGNEDYVVSPGRTNKKTFRFSILHEHSDRLQLRSRLEMNYFEKEGQENENGFLLFQDVIWSTADQKLRLTFRYAIFETGSYDSRIYAYENEVLYAYSLPPYYGRGTRYYLVARYKVSRNLSCWFRIAKTSWNDRTSVSSGLEEIEGNSKSDLKVQVRYGF